MRDEKTGCITPLQCLIKGYKRRGLLQHTADYRIVIYDLIINMDYRIKISDCDVHIEVSG